MRILAGPNSTVHFTSLSKGSSQALDASFSEPNSSSIDLAKARAHQQGILELAKAELGQDAIQKICLLDPKGEKELSPEDGDGRFQWFLFGVRFACSTPLSRSPTHCLVFHAGYLRYGAYFGDLSSCS